MQQLTLLSWLQLPGVNAEESFLDAASDELYDVYSDEFFECEYPMSRAGSLRGVQARC